MMRNRRLKKILNFTYELRDCFTDYLDDINDYFKDDQNKKNHEELYQKVNNLNNNIDDLMLKYGYVKVEESKENEC